MEKKVIITGGSGFLGRKVAEKLRMKGYKVFQMALPDENVEGEDFFRGDITNPETIVFPETDIIIHCAGILESNHPSDELLYKVNYEGTVNVFLKGLEAGMKRFIMISTIAALGPQGELDAPMTEDTVPKPDNAYGKSKLKAESFLENAKTKDVDITILRPTVLYGEGMNINSSGMKTFVSLRKGIMPFVGNGNTIFNLLHVDNLVQSIVLSIEKGKGFNIYIVSEGPYTLSQVVWEVERVMSKKGHIRTPAFILYFLAIFFQIISPLFKGPPPISMVKYRGLTSNIWHVSSSKIERELGYYPVVSLREGVRRTIEYYGWREGS